MARIAISTFGSNGGIFPFLALGIGLRQRGHEVKYVVDQTSRRHIAAAGFEVRDFPGNADEFFVANARPLFSGISWVASNIVLVDQWLAAELPEKIESLRDACQDVDLLIARAGHIAAPIASEAYGFKWVHVTLTPFTLPTEHFPPHPLPPNLPKRVQRYLNRAAWLISTTGLRWIVDNKVNKIRAQYGLPPSRNSLVRGNQSSTLTAVAVSSAFMELQADWPEYVKVTGFCYWDKPHDWQESPILREFFDSEKPVIAVSSGSMSPTLETEFSSFFKTTIAGVLRIGARALVVGAAPSLIPELERPDVLCVDYVPFSEIYPRCTAAVHHGGPGTTAQALRAGIPSLIAPWGIEQYYTAHRVATIGAGRWLHRRFYSKRRVESALTAILAQPYYRTRLEAISAAISKEDGIANLCAAIEDVLR